MKRFLILILFVISAGANAQEMLGIANSNFAGNMGMGLNPASMLLMPYRWELNLISGDLFLENNYVAYPKNRIIPTSEGQVTLPHGGFLDSYSLTPKNAHARTFLRLPSFIYRTREQAFGIHTAVRTDISLRNISADLAKLSYEGFGYTPLGGIPVTINPFRIGGMTWTEIGLSYGKIFPKGNDRIIVAGTVSFINAFQGLYFINNGTDLTINSDTTLTVQNIDAEVGFAFPTSSGDALTINGRGLGLNLGFYFVKNPYRGVFEKSRTIDRKRYDYRLGVSLIDAGMVSFTKNSYVYDINNSSTTFNNYNSVKPVGVNGMDSLIRNTFITGASSMDNSFALVLPMAVSSQFDVCLHPRWYANATVVQRVNPPMPHIDLPNIVSASLRYETSYFEIAVPYSFYDYYLHRIGVAVRYRFLVLGTDKLGPYVTNNDVYGFDFYFGIKLSNYDFTRPGKRTRQDHCAAYN
ncbi:MAG TPA: hypothetical protein VI757_08715 [Bacteroidia bacterium]|nr:hypothetical protein [Bacteroidia bacterium]